MLRLQPETKAAAKVLMVMDGSALTARDASEVRLVASDLAARGGDNSLVFLLSSTSCGIWQPQAPKLVCEDVGAKAQQERVRMLTKAFVALLNPVKPAR